ELERQYGKIIDEDIITIEKLKKNADHYNMSIPELQTVDREKSISQLQEFYKNLISAKVIDVLEYSNDFLPKIIDRAINKGKPFSETKTELKDAVIWLSYANYAEEYDLDDCILLSENVADFCDRFKIKEGIFEIDDELKKDSSKFIFYK